jgi:hypothetical protein
MGKPKYFSSEWVRLIPVLATIVAIFPLLVEDEKKILDFALLTFNPEDSAKLLSVDAIFKACD